MKIDINELELNELKEMRYYFGKNDKTVYEHHAFNILTRLINKLTIPVVIVPKGTLFCDCELPTSDFKLDDGTICCCACEKELAK
jgi:hypothetical protein